MTEPREPDRAAEGRCTCPVSVRATRSELTFAQFKRVACRACQAQACSEWLMEIADKV